MISIFLFGSNQSDECSLEVTRFVNDNIAIVLKVLRDYVFDDNGYAINDYLELSQYRINVEQWNNWLEDLIQIVSSSNTRDYLMPHYKLLLYYTIKWFINCNDYPDTNKLLRFRVPQKLRHIIRDCQYLDTEEKKFTILQISNLKNYIGFIFEDLDFLPDYIATLTQLYLKSPECYAELFYDVNLKDYRDIMPKDIQELFDNFCSEIDDKNDYKTDISKIYNELIVACSFLQANAIFKDATENQRNDYIRDLFNYKGIYNTKDQTRRGLSGSGRDSGMPDIFLLNGQNSLSIIEGVNLRSVSKKTINDHINRIYKYDTLGNDVNFLVSYVQVPDFKSFWETYYGYISSFEYEYEKIFYFVDTKKEKSELKSAIVILN